MPPTTKKRRADDDSEDEVPHTSVAKKNKSAAAASAPDGKDDEGNPFWELSNKRRGISLSVEQYLALIKAAPGINAALRAKGQDVDDPDEMDIEEPEVATNRRKSKSDKSNIEATSDEDEGDD
ncbi:hypothetical protein TrVFT333_000651 [Trichoderma virens FT-333]|nr:hypothetical protein TrVFT333_000651 [Trichoderma virens FT-333]